MSLNIPKEILLGYDFRIIKALVHKLSQCICMFHYAYSLFGPNLKDQALSMSLILSQIY
jgi:hypothetical protein